MDWTDKHVELYFNSFLLNEHQEWHYIPENLGRRSAKYPVARNVLSTCFWMLIRLVFFMPPRAIPVNENVRFLCVYFNALEYTGGYEHTGSKSSFCSLVLSRNTGSDHLWAGLVSRLVNSVEYGIGRLPSAIFRANVPSKIHFEGNVRTELSTDAKKNSFK